MNSGGGGYFLELAVIDTNHSSKQERSRPMVDNTDSREQSPPEGNRWRLALSLDKQRQPVAGSEKALADAIRRGADLRIYTEFRHNEHVDRDSDNPELVQEVSDFRVTYLLEDRWTAGIMNLRQPVGLVEDGFGPRASMSFFMYNQNGLQAIARPYLDGKPDEGLPGSSPPYDQGSDPNTHRIDDWDAGTNAPSQNFVYDFESYGFHVLDVWEEVLSHTEDGTVVSGSVEDLARECARGRDVKVALRGLCADLADDPAKAMAHEVFVHVGPNYYYTEQKRLWGAAQPVVRVKPSIPIRYRSKGWDFGWVLARTDGYLARWLVNPYTLQFQKSQVRCAARWFVR